MNNRLIRRTLVLNTTADELKLLFDAASDLRDCTPRDIQLGEVTLSNVLVCGVQTHAHLGYDPRSGIPDTVQTTVSYHAVPKES